MSKNGRIVQVRWGVIGTEGALYINCGETGLEIHDAQGVRMPDTAYWPKAFGHRMGALCTELEYFTDCIRKGHKPDRITPEESRDAVAVMAAAPKSSQAAEVIALC